MAFWRDLFNGLGQVLGEAGLALDWSNTFKRDGIPMLQIKIRNFLRSASPELRDKIKDSLERQAMLHPEPDERPIFHKIWQIYIHELADFE